MSLSKTPSFVGVDEKQGKITVAFLTSWYDEERCSECPHFKYIDTESTEIGYCEQIEKDEPCEITGIRHVGETNGSKT